MFLALSGKSPFLPGAYLIGAIANTNAYKNYIWNIHLGEEVFTLGGGNTEFQSLFSEIFSISENAEGNNDTYSFTTLTAILDEFRLTEVFDTGIIEMENDYSIFTDNFSLKNPIEIKKFLSSNTFLLSVILESKSVVHRYFGETTELEVELFTDPEDIEELPRLFVNIKTESDVKTALESFDNFLHNWYLDKILLSGSLLSFHIKYL